MDDKIKVNPLGTEPVSKLLRKFTIPSIIAMLVGALYNIVDQFFIGRSVGRLGNAATSIAFPLSISCVAIALLFGIGGASSFNIAMGEGKREEALHYIGNAIVLLLGCGVVLLLVTQVFLSPMLLFFGASDDVLGYAKAYTSITSFGFPFFILATGGGHLIRADGSPKFSMLCNLTGAILNVILDAIFVFGFHMGMEGAALATIIGQIVSAILAIYYLCHYKTGTLRKDHFILRKKNIIRIMSLGAAPCGNQLAMMVVQIVMNNSLNHYGGSSAYGEEIPVACAGIVSKVSQLYFAFIIGLSQGLQPIVSFNYGAGNYYRVKKAYLMAISFGLGISLVAFSVFQFWPREIISLFGEGTEIYYQFAINYFRIFLMFTFVNFLQPITSNFFTAIGKPQKGVFLSLTRQIIFLLPLIIAMPLFLGIDGVLYAGPIADVLAGIVTGFMVIRELRGKIYEKVLVKRK